MTPADHKSQRFEYCFLITSGAIYKEVPAQVLSLVNTFLFCPSSSLISSKYDVDRPKSIILI
jgi:hypothetical protein